MKIAIIQSNYIPWKGYFDIIHDVDLFIFYDDVQYTSFDWRNRNKIKVREGTYWLSVPVGSNTNRLINEVKIQDLQWGKKHLKNFEHFYSKTKYFKEYHDFLSHVYLEKKWEYLSELNQYLIKTIAIDFLKCKVRFDDSLNYSQEGKKLLRLINIMKQCNAETYYSGPLAKSYIDEDELKKNGIEVVWKDYSNYPEYRQLFPPFEHHVSILDLLFNTGPDAPYYIWGWRENR